MMWSNIEGSWNGAKAAAMYKGPLVRALRKSYPKRTQFTVLEDNDPTGLKSKLAAHAKKTAGLAVFRIPPRSPDLNVCDYALWKEVNKRMRRQERSWSTKKTETREAYIQRLQRTAKSLPKKFIHQSIGDMQRRCQRLYAKRGGSFEEGGRGK